MAEHKIMVAGKELTMRTSPHANGSLFVAQCIEEDVASQGDTEEAAVENLREALELFFESEPEPVLSETEPGV